ncbi:MAG: TonB family protein [Acetobacteraceae bacterium]
MPPIARLHPTRTKLTPRAAPENSFSGPFFSTIILHLCLVTLLIWQSRHHDFLGHAQGDLPDKVEVTFDTPMQRAMQGPENNSDAGAQKAGLLSHGKPVRNSEDLQDEVARDETSGSATPQPMSPVMPPDEAGERTTSATTSAAIPTDAPPLPPRHAQRRQSAPKSKNPFENMANLDYSDASPSPRRRTGHYGGAHGPVDMSYGPLVKNGTVNSPNLSVRKIRGVSEDYGEELSRWIRSRLFYPADAVANGEGGESSLHVVLDRQGRVKSVRVTGQSGSYALDAAAMSIFSMHAQLPPIPPDMVGDHFDIDMTINYILIRG